MYRSPREMWQGWTKNLYPLMGGRPRAAINELAKSTPWFPLLFVLCAIFTPILQFAGTLLMVEHVEYAFALRKNRYPVWRIIYYIPASFWYAAALLASARRYARGAVAWKGREIPVGVR